MKLVAVQRLKLMSYSCVVIFFFFFVRHFLKCLVSVDSLSLITFFVSSIRLIMWVAGNLRVAFINPIALKMAKTP